MILYVFVGGSAPKLWSVQFEMRKYKSVDFEDSQSFSGRVQCIAPVNKSQQVQKHQLHPC